MQRTLTLVNNMHINNKSVQDNIIRRRALVAKLRLRGFTLDAIALKLLEAGISNPFTGKAYSKVTIKKDLDAMKEEWRRVAADDIEVHQQRQLAEIAEVKTMAWSDRDGALALRAIDLEMRLLGTKAPDKLDVNMNINYSLVIELVEAIKSEGDDYERVFRRLIELSRARQHVIG